MEEIWPNDELRGDFWPNMENHFSLQIFQGFIQGFIFQRILWLAWSSVRQLLQKMRCNKTLTVTVLSIITIWFWTLNWLLINLKKIWNCFKKKLLISNPDPHLTDQHYSCGFCQPGDEPCWGWVSFFFQIFLPPNFVLQASFSFWFSSFKFCV